MSDTFLFIFVYIEDLDYYTNLSQKILLGKDMHNIQQLMKQAEALQKKMVQMQGELALVEVEGSAGGGLVKATVTGKHEVKSIKIDKSLITQDDIEVLEDLIVAAVNNANTNALNKSEEEMKKLGIPPELAKMTI